MPQECPLEVEQLIDMCLATDPADRPTAKQAFDIISACSSAGAASGLPHVQPAVQPRPQDRPALQAGAVTLEAGQQQQQPQSQSRSQHTVQDDHVQCGSQQLAQSKQPEPSVPDGLQYSTQSSAEQLADSSQKAASADEGHVGRQEQEAVHSGSQSAQAGPSRLLHQPVVPMPNQQGTTVPAWGYDTAAGLPTGVLGHLYPSPFAVAADASSGGPEWDWQTAAVV